MLLLAAPLILSQIVGTWVFYDRFWITIMRRLAAAATSDIALIVEGRHQFAENDQQRFFALVDGATGFKTELMPPGTKPPGAGAPPRDRIQRFLAAALTERNLGPFIIDGSDLAALPSRPYRR